MIAMPLGGQTSFVGNISYLETRETNTRMVLVAGDGADGAREFGDRGLGNVRVHGDRGLFADVGRVRVPAGVRVPADGQQRRPALDVGGVGRAAGRARGYHVGGSPRTADRHGTGYRGPGGRGRIRPPGGRVQRAHALRVVRGRAGGHGTAEALGTAVAGHSRHADRRRPRRGRSGRMVRRTGHRRLEHGRRVAVRRLRRLGGVRRRQPAAVARSTRRMKMRFVQILSVFCYQTFLLPRRIFLLHTKKSIDNCNNKIILSSHLLKHFNNNPTYRPILVLRTGVCAEFE